MNYFLESTMMITENPSIGNAVMHSHDFYEIYLFLDGRMIIWWKEINIGFTREISC